MTSNKILSFSKRKRFCQFYKAWLMGRIVGLVCFKVMLVSVGGIHANYIHDYSLTRLVSFIQTCQRTSKCWRKIFLNLPLYLAEGEGTCQSEEWFYHKGALDNTLKISVCLNFVYHVQYNCFYMNTKKKKKNRKFIPENEKWRNQYFC